MSQEIFLNIYSNGQEMGVGLEQIKKDFKDGIIKDDQQLQFIKVQYSDDDGADIYFHILEDGTCSGFMAAKLVGHCDKIFGIMLKLLKNYNGVVYFAGGRPLIGHDDAKKQIPQGMIESLGDPIVVTKSADILNAIRQS